MLKGQRVNRERNPGGQTDNTRFENPVLLDDLNELLICLLSSAVRVYVDAQWLSDPNSVGELDEDTAC